MKISLVENSNLFKNLSLLLKAGLPLNKAIKILASQTDREVSNRLLCVSQDLEQGISFTESMSAHGLIQDEVKHAFKTSEQNAFLEQALNETADWYAKKAEFIKNMRRALSYPLVVLSFSLLSLIFMLFFILPSYSQMFSSFNLKLPFLTILVMSMANSSYLILFSLVIAAILLVRIFKDSDKRLKMPLAGKIYLNLIMRDFCSGLSYQLRSGVSFLHALRNAKEGLKCKKVKDSLTCAIGDIENGSAISQAFVNCGIFPKMFIQFVAVGEETSTLANVFCEAGRYFEAEAENMLKKFTSFFEPAATLVVGGVVAVVALSMIMPLFSIVNSML